MKTLCTLFVVGTLVVSVASATEPPKIHCTVTEMTEQAVSGECSLDWEHKIGKSDLRWDFRGSVETTDDSNFRIEADEFGKTILVRAYAYHERMLRPKVEICWDGEHLLHRRNQKDIFIFGSGEQQSLSELEYAGTCFRSGTKGAVRVEGVRPAP